MCARARCVRAGRVGTNTGTLSTLGGRVGLEGQLADVDRKVAVSFHIQQDAAIITSFDRDWRCPRRPVSGRRRRLSVRVRLRRSPRRLRRTCAYPARLGLSHRKPASTPAPQPATPTRLLHLGHDQHPRSPHPGPFYDGKRAQGKRYTRAVLALARRRVNVLWAMLRDHQPYIERRQGTPPKRRCWLGRTSAATHTAVETS
jgi:hypothetical protein